MPRVVSRGFLALLVAVSTPLALGRAGPANAQTTTQRLILTPTQGSTFRVQAIYDNAEVTCEAKRRKDLTARYRGKLEILRESDGDIAIIDHVTFDEYLRGLSEVPRSWPIETLKAQVVAARSYALYHLEHPTASGRNTGYDICSTDQCQVYRGVSVEQGPFGEAWVKAVTDTTGQVLRYNDRPIQAFYHSTSPGRTKRNFPGGTPLPYLRSVDGQDDDSPVARWSVPVPLAHIGPILDAAGEWSGGAVTSVSLSGTTVRVSGAGGSVTMEKSTFRNALNSQAACVYPATYPTPGSTGNKLPQTVPSIDFSLSRSGTTVVLTGRGWGHGVGMSQYGARSLAERGRSYANILSYFYAGLAPDRVTEPGAIRVLIVEDAAILRLGIEGSATVETSSGSTLAPGDRFEVRGGEALDIRRGIGPSSQPVLTVDLTTGPTKITGDGTIALAYTLSRPARVSMIVRQGAAEIVRTDEVSQIAGPNVLTVPLGPPPTSAPTPGGTASPTSTDVPPAPSPRSTLGPSVSPTPTTTIAVTPMPTPLAHGSYEMFIEAYDGLDRVRTEPVALTVEAASPSPGTLPPPESGSGRWPAIGIAALSVAAGATWLVLVSRRRRRPGPMV